VTYYNTVKALGYICRFFRWFVIDRILKFTNDLLGSRIMTFVQYGNNYRSKHKFLFPSTLTVFQGYLRIQILFGFIKHTYPKFLCQNWSLII